MGVLLEAYKPKVGLWVSSWKHINKKLAYGCPFESIVNGHRKQQIELYREPTNTVSFSNFIDPRLT